MARRLTKLVPDKRSVATPPEPRVRRRRLGAADAREVILAAAETLLIRFGPEGLRLTEIASQAGVTHPNVLYHFGSVAELQRQLAQRVAVRLADDVARVFTLDGGSAMPTERVVAAVFSVFDERGYARLLAWLVLSGNEPDFKALEANLEFLRAAITTHPALRGESGARTRALVVPAIKLVVVAAIGYGLTGHVVDGFFSKEHDEPGVPAFLGDLLAGKSLR